MVIFLQSGARLAPYLRPDVDRYTRKLTIVGNPSVREIIADLGVPSGLVAFAVVDGNHKRLDYRPVDGEYVTLQPPAGGG